MQQICEIIASSWFYYKEICYDARSHERKKNNHIRMLWYVSYFSLFYRVFSIINKQG
jgi:hypothetical protein